MVAPTLTIHRIGINYNTERNLFIIATIRKRSVYDRYAVTEKYLYSRARALTLRPNDLKVKLSADNQVYGAVIDMPMGASRLGTLVCLVNGTANLYFNNGDGITGEASKYRSVANASRALIANMSQVLPICERVIEFDLPAANNYYVYLLTRRGIYKTSFDPSKFNPMLLDDKTRLNRFALFLSNKVMNELMNSQIKDKAAANKSAEKK